MHWLEFVLLTWGFSETYKLAFGWEFLCKLQNTTTCTIQNCEARWSIPSPFAFKMPWKHRGSRQNTLSALESCDSSSFRYEDPGDCLLSIHQRQWVGWAATAARNPQYRAQAIPLHMQRLWSRIVLNREPSGWASHVCPGRAATFAPLKSNAVSAGILQQAPLPWANQELKPLQLLLGETQPPAWEQCQGCMIFVVVFWRKWGDGVDLRGQGLYGLLCVAVWVLQGSACCVSCAELGLLASGGGVL